MMRKKVEYQQQRNGSSLILKKFILSGTYMKLQIT